MPTGDHEGAHGAEGGVLEWSIVFKRCADGFASQDIPEPSRIVVARGHHMMPIRTESGMVNGPEVFDARPRRFSRSQIPQLCGTASRSKNGCSVRADVDGGHARPMCEGHVELLSGQYVPKIAVTLPIGRDDHVAIGADCGIMNPVLDFHRIVSREAGSGIPNTQGTIPARC